MRSKSLAVVAVAAVMALGTLPAPAESAYHMNGQGTITMEGAGMPACAVNGVPTAGCETSTVEQKFNWGALTVNGYGRLQGETVAGEYKCASEGTGYESRVRGGTRNFQLTFNFVCTSQGAEGPTYINGWFSNVTQPWTGMPTAYKDVSSGHPHPTPVGPGTFSFKGYFLGSSSAVNPNTITASNGAPMSCTGGFVPTVMDGTNIKAVAFVGQCDALAA